MNFIRACLRNAGNLVTMLKGNIKQNNCKIITKVFQGGGLIRSSDEVSVMEMEQRDQLILNVICQLFGG